MNQSDEQVGRWKDDVPVQPLNIIDTRTFAERVEEALTIEAFRAWLESKDGDDEVGIAGSAIDNPIHHFLRLHFKEARADSDRDEFPRLEVYYTEIVLYRRFLFQSASSAAMPLWASEFSAVLDRRRYRSGDATPVTAEQALAILAEVEKELADTSEG